MLKLADEGPSEREGNKQTVKRSATHCRLSVLLAAQEITVVRHPACRPLQQRGYKPHTQLLTRGREEGQKTGLSNVIWKQTMRVAESGNRLVK